MEAGTGSDGITWGKVQGGVQEIHLDSWARFSTLVEAYYAAEAPAYVFRGQANAEWMLCSTLDRQEKRFPTMRNYSGGAPAEFKVPPVSRPVHLNAFKELIRDKLPASEFPTTEQDWWALAQHHGLATPLLDWTYYPFVALFFAFEEEHCGNSDGSQLIDPRNRAVFAASTSTVGSPKRLADGQKVGLFVPMGVRSPRLLAQGGVFMEMPKDTDLEACVKKQFAGDSYDDSADPACGNPHGRAILQKIVVPNDNRERCLKWLNAAGINRARLFPDLDGVARYVNSMWSLNFDTSHGYLLRGIGRAKVGR